MYGNYLFGYAYLPVNTTVSLSNVKTLAFLGEGKLSELDIPINQPPSHKQVLKRPKSPPPSLSAAKHPHGQSPFSPVHPYRGQFRTWTFGNDNSSVNRQTRIQQRPTPSTVNGQPYAGPEGQVIGTLNLADKRPRRNVKSVRVPFLMNFRPIYKKKLLFLLPVILLWERLAIVWEFQCLQSSKHNWH